MKNQIVFNRKALTKLLNRNYREKILSSISQKRFEELKIRAYSQYVVDSQIIQRVKEYADDSKSGWGFPQLNILCCVKKNGNIEKKFFEFNTINHFLKDKDGDSAVDVVKCILILWTKLDGSIKDFDYELIDKELVRLDKEIEEKRRKDKKINEAGKKIKEAIEPMLNSHLHESYDIASASVKKEVEEVLEKFKSDKEIFQYAIALNRNTKETIERNEFFIDIGYKIDEESEFVVLACHVDPKRDEEKKEEKQVSSDSIA